MLTRFIRIQLIIFTIASVVGVGFMVFTYLQAPTLLGVGRITVTVQLPESGGLYRFSNVTYRGVQIGRVTDIALTPEGAEATMSLNTSPKIPADLAAEVRSISAVGEQYVDLRPRTDSPPYLQDGSVIAASEVSVPQQVGPMLDQVSKLVSSIPKDNLAALLDESFKGFNGAGGDFGSLLDSFSTLSKDFKDASGQTRSLIDDSGPLLDTQAETADSIRLWARSLAGFTGQLAANDQQVRTLLKNGPGFAEEASQLLEQLKPTLPVLLANLRTVGQVLVTYRPSLEQLLVLLPPYVAAQDTYGLSNKNGTGQPKGDFSLSLGDPPACTTGFLPPSAWRSPADVSEIDTPDGLYCKLPQDSPISVRGIRNAPCMGVPGKRAPTVEICNSDKPYEPLAQRQNVLGPYPFDPNLVSQGVPFDQRVNPGENIYGPTEGTPRPAQTPPALEGPPPGATESVPPPAGADQGSVVPPPGVAPGPTVAPASSVTDPSAPGPPVAVAQYNTRTGEYVTPDGQTVAQSDLAAGASPKTWKDLLPK